MANNKHIMKEIVEQYYQGNFQVVIDHLSDHVKWVSHKMVNVQLNNKQAVINFLEHVPVGRFSFKNNPFIIDDYHVVVEGICSYTNKEGKTIENFYCDIFTFTNNTIDKVSAYFISVMES